jgi:hypothetical protein
MEKKKKEGKINPRFKCNKVSVLVVLVLLLQHPVLVLVFNQMHCGCLARWLGQETAL